MKLKYSEAFYSLQGEGKFVGQPSIFLRTFGCNFQCQGFGLPRGHVPDKKDQERSKVNPDDYDSFQELPLVQTGCDSYASWDARFKHFAKSETVEELVETLTNLCPNKQWANDVSDVHLIMTGGEPLLAWQKIYPELFKKLADRGMKNVTFETNGTQFLRPEFKEWLENSDRRIHITWSVSPKLSISGHHWEEAIKPLVLKEYSQVPNSRLYTKFVVSDMIDFEEIEKAVKSYKEVGADIQDVYAMPVGGTTQGLELSEKKVAEICLQKGFRFSPRLHVNIWGNTWGS